MPKYAIHYKKLLTLKAPVTTADDGIHKYFVHCVSEKIRIHMKIQALFSSKIKVKS